jgi:hypothetical protein
MPWEALSQAGGVHVTLTLLCAFGRRCVSIVPAEIERSGHCFPLQVQIALLMTERGCESPISTCTFVYLASENSVGFDLLLSIIPHVVLGQGRGFGIWRQIFQNEAEVKRRKLTGNVYYLVNSNQSNYYWHRSRRRKQRRVAITRSGFLEDVTVKRTMIAAFASLMLAGALSAVSGATSVHSVGSLLVVGTGSAPVPTTLPGEACQAQSAPTIRNF